MSRIEIECKGCRKLLSLTYHQYHVKKIRNCSFECRKKRVITNCETCGKQLDLPYADYHVKNIRRCSFNCRKKPPRPCTVCGKLMEEYQPRAKYCSIDCRGIARRGKNHPLYKRGFFTGKSVPYKYLTINGKKLLEHRYIMEQHLGRKLETWEEVHHIDKDPLNNDLHNLMVISSEEHLKLHAQERKRDKGGRFI